MFVTSTGQWAECSRGGRTPQWAYESQGMQSFPWWFVCCSCETPVFLGIDNPWKTIVLIKRLLRVYYARVYTVKWNEHRGEREYSEDNKNSLRPIIRDFNARFTERVNFADYPIIVCWPWFVQTREYALQYSWFSTDSESTILAICMDEHVVS